jgi:quinol monooxygenase YgiN
MYVVTVEFTVAPERTRDFAAAVLDNARRSVEAEPGCRRFDVCADPADPSRFFLYELYDDQAAFAAHLATAHFAAFDRQVRDWVTAKAVRTLLRLGD